MPNHALQRTEAGRRVFPRIHVLRGQPLSLSLGAFARASDHQKLGNVLPADQQGQISNVAIVVSWNPHSSKVALLVFYGTKLSELLLFTKDDAGQFQAVSWEQPDAEAIYQQSTGRRLPRPGDGHNQNAVGPWGTRTPCAWSRE